MTITILIEEDLRRCISMDEDSLRFIWEGFARLADQRAVEKKLGITV